MTNLGETFDSL